MSERREYTQEFKQEAVRLSEDSEQTVAAVARDLGIVPEILYRWRAESRKRGAQAFPGHGKIAESEAEVQALRRELERVKRERDILKKALAIFSQER
jgi:transposase